MAGWEPLDAHRACRGRKHRIFAAPQYVRLAGVWRPIDDLLEVTQVGQGAAAQTTITFDNKAWIRFTPRRMPAGAVIASRCTKRAFGPSLDLRRTDENVLEYGVTFSEGVEPVGNGWRFTDPEGVALGCFMDKWQSRWPEDMAIGSNSVGLRLDGLAARGETVIDLDPETVNPVTNGTAQCWRSSNADPTWHDTVTGAGTSSQASNFQCRAYNQGDPPGWRLIARGLMRFDTTGYEDAETAYLKLSRQEYTEAEREFIARASLSFPLATSSNYANAYTGIGQNPIGECVADGNPEIGNRKSPDIVAAGEWEATSAFDLIISEYHDWADEEPGDSTNYQINYYTMVGWLYLEVTMPRPDPAIRADRIETPARIDGRAETSLRVGGRAEAI